MEALFIFLIVTTMIPILRIQTNKIQGIEHMKTVVHMIAMIIAQTTFILCFLFNEYTPGYIYVNEGYLTIAYDGISLTYLIVSATLTNFCIISLCEFMSIDKNLKKNISLLFLLEVVLFNFFFN